MSYRLDQLINDVHVPEYHTLFGGPKARNSVPTTIPVIVCAPPPIVEQLTVLLPFPNP